MRNRPELRPDFRRQHRRVSLGLWLYLARYNLQDGDASYPSIAISSAASKQRATALEHMTISSRRPGTKLGGHLSPEARRRIALAMKKRWEERKKPKNSA